MKRKLSPPHPTNKILRVYYIGIPSTCTEDILIGVPDYSSSSFFFNEEEAIPPPPDKQNTPGILYRNTNTTG